jgi:glycine oxidase
VISVGDSESPDSIAIAGGGLIGLSLAWCLSQAGFRVSVFDKGEIGGEASWAGAGMLAPGGEIEGPSPLAQLAIEARQMYRDYVRELEDDSGREIDYQECGALELAYSDEEFEELERRSARQAALSVSSKPVTSDQIKTFWPRIRSQGLVGGRFYPGDGIVNPRDLVDALSKICTGAGVVLRPRAAIRAIKVEAAGVMFTLESGPLWFSAGIIAAGAWSSEIPLSGVPAVPRAEPVRGHLLGYMQPARTCSTIIRRGNTYLLQRANGLLIAGASVEHVGFDRTISPEIAGQLANDAE